MPDKPLWLNRLSVVIQDLERSEDPWIDRATLQSMLGVGQRRGQQLLSPLARRRIGSSLVVDRGELVSHLAKIASGEVAYYERRRREGLATQMRDWIEQPPVVVALTEAQVRHIEARDIDGLPPGVELGKGYITVRFEEPEEALRKLMALAMAIGRNRQAFDDCVG